MPHIIKQLGQLRPANTTAASLYSPAANTETISNNIIICNTSTSAAAYRLFVDDDGTAYTEETAFAWDISLEAGATDIFEVKITMNNANGNIGVRSDTNDALTFTCNGEEFT